MALANFVLARIMVITIITVVAFPASALDHGFKDRKSRDDENKQPSMVEDESNTKLQSRYTEDFSYSLLESESEEDRASWFIAQSIPQTEKDSKKKVQEEIKASKKMIKKGRKDCRKQNQLSKKNSKKTIANN